MKSDTYGMYYMPSQVRPLAQNGLVSPDKLANVVCWPFYLGRPC